MTILKRAILDSIEPVCYAIGGVLILLLWTLFGPSDASKVLSAIQEFLERNGIWATLAASLLEAVVVVNLYFPGSIIIVASVLATKGNPTRCVWVVGIAALGFIIGSLLNYMIGKAAFAPVLSRIRGDAWVRRVQNWQNKWGHIALPLCFVNPNLGSFVSVAAGRSGLPILRFIAISALANVFWAACWGLVTYRFADTITEVATHSSFVVLILLLWAGVSLVRSIRRLKREPLR